MKEEDSHLVAAGSLHIHFTFSGHQIIYSERGGENDLAATKSLLICGKIINDLVLANCVYSIENW